MRKKLLIVLGIIIPAVGDVFYLKDRGKTVIAEQNTVLVTTKKTATKTVITISSRNKKQDLSTEITDSDHYIIYSTGKLPWNHDDGAIIKLEYELLSDGTVKRPNGTIVKDSDHLNVELSYAADKSQVIKLR